jgi:DNA invertase Pin-like site-specific DNA recombinase
MAKTCKLVAYYRVSTNKQGLTGLGMEAQRSAVESYRALADCSIIATYTEVESGKRNDRPELAKAIAHARRSKATLVVAKLDRLARNQRFLLGLLEGNVDVAFGDFPSIPTGAMGKYFLSNMAGLAELEAGLTSERTKAALAAAKARGVKLGTPANLTHEARVKGNQRAVRVNKALAVEAYADVAPLVVELKAEGLSLRAIAKRLDQAGHTTRSGKPWNQVQVKRVLDRSGA